MIKKEKAVVRRVEGREWWRVFLMFTFDHSMNSPDTVTHSKSHYAFLRLFLTLVFSFLAFFFTLLFIALLALLFDQFSDPSSTSLPSLCKIVSSSQFSFSFILSSDCSSVVYLLLTCAILFQVLISGRPRSVNWGCSITRPSVCFIRFIPVNFDVVMIITGLLFSRSNFLFLLFYV